MQHLSYFLLECLKMFTSEAMYTINYVCEKNVNFVFNLFNSTGIFLYIVSSHSVALFVK